MSQAITRKLTKALTAVEPIATVAGPEAIAAVEAVKTIAPEVEELVAKGRVVGNEILHAAGLTSDENYEGWLAVLVLLYVYLEAPVKLGLQIAIQVSGVLQQLFEFLKGTGSVIEKGAETLTKDILGNPILLDIVQAVNPAFGLLSPLLRWT